jgi:type II secretory pathway pseudopilin PulG
MINGSYKNQSGITIIETLFYVIILALLSVAVINALIIMSKAFKEVRVTREIIQSGEIMERISREIKQAYQINTVSSGDLKLNTRDGFGASKTVEFLLTGSNVQLLENDILTGDLNSPDITVSNLSFSQINTARGSAVKVFYTVSSEHDGQNRQYDFQDTVVLRGDY